VNIFLIFQTYFFLHIKNLCQKNGYSLADQMAYFFISMSNQKKMEELSGKLKSIKGKLIINGIKYDYEEFTDPNRPHNFRTIVFYRAGKDSIIIEYDTERDVLQKIAERVLNTD